MHMFKGNIRVAIEVNPVFPNSGSAWLKVQDDSGLYDVRIAKGDDYVIINPNPFIGKLVLSPVDDYLEVDCFVGALHANLIETLLITQIGDPYAL